MKANNQACEGRVWRAISLAATMAVLAAAAGCGRSSADRLVVYTSLDRLYAEPILADFTRQTGIQVDALYDSEAVKTVGLVNRLLAEKNRPRCDVFWNNEELRVRQLERQGVLAGPSAWRAVGYRSRALVVNTRLLPIDQAPRTLRELTNAVWRGKLAMAYPLFGTTATHFLALRAQWGPADWEAWCRALQANRPLLLDGNSVVVRMVGAGEAALGLTDTDDVRMGLREGLPVAAVSLGAETMLVPSTIARVRPDAPAQAVNRLVDYLAGPAVGARLVEAGFWDGTDPGAAAGSSMAVRWDSVLSDLEPATSAMRGIFLR
ncbi:MAG: substrate-binding domain-containing protein [Verrucomicrobia bacterium]|nr:substrate-binding domain-containing protein [Verrucomicrobiota bacterium]